MDKTNDPRRNTLARGPTARLCFALLPAVAALCCNFGPAWSPDGTEVAFMVPIASAEGEEAFELARYSLESEEVSPIRIGTTYRYVRPVWHPDGRLFALAAARIEREDGEQSNRFDVIELFEDREPRLVAELGEREAKDDLLPSAFFHNGLLFCPIGFGLESDGDDSLSLFSVDVETGEVTRPLGNGFQGVLFKGPAGLFYLGKADEAGDGDSSRDAFVLGSVSGGPGEPLRFVERTRVEGEIGGMSICSVGRRHLALVLKVPAERVEGEGEGDGGEAHGEEDGTRVRYEVRVFDLEGEEKARVVLPGVKQTLGAFALGHEDRYLWASAIEGDEISRVDWRTGRIDRYQVGAWAGDDNAVCGGLSVSPRDPIVAIQLFPKDDDEGAELPADLLLVDESAEPKAAVRVKAPR